MTASPTFSAEPHLHPDTTPKPERRPPVTADALPRVTPDQARAAMLTVADRTPPDDIKPVLQLLGLVPRDRPEQTVTSPSSRPPRSSHRKDTVDTTDARRILNDWVAAGRYLNEFAAITGINPETIAGIRKGRYERAMPDIVNRILAAPSPDDPNIMDPRYVAIGPVIAHIQALRDAGRDYFDIANATGLRVDTICNITRSKDRVYRVRTERARLILAIPLTPPAGEP